MDWLARILGRQSDPDRNRAYALNKSAIEHIAREQFDEAETLLQEAIRLSPNTAAFHHNLGAVYMGQKRLAFALKEMRKATKLDPKDVETQVAIAKLLSDMGKTDEALAEYRQVCLNAPDDWRSHLSLGNALLEQEKLDEAMPHLEKAAELKPREELAQLVLAMAYEKAGVLDKAIKAYDMVRKVTRTGQNQKAASEKVAELRDRLSKK